MPPPRTSLSAQLLCLSALLLASAGVAAASVALDPSVLAAPPFIPDGIPGAAEASAWLESYYAQRQARPRWPEAVHLPACNATAAASAPVEAPAPPPRAAGELLTATAEGATPGAEALAPAAPRNVILAAVGDGWSLAAARWLDDPAAAAGLDLVVVSYGAAPLDCPQCLRIFHGHGPK